jgi:phosphatidylinositol alpha-1,6-mannosyltransferase
LETSLTNTESNKEQYFIFGQVIKQAKNIVRNSQNSAKILDRLGDDAAAKTLVLHSGVDSDVFIPANKSQTTLSILGWLNKNVVLTVGRLQARKDQDMMFKAVPEIIEHISTFLYSVVGDGDWQYELVNLVEKLKSHNYVRFLSGISNQEMINCYQQ